MSRITLEELRKDPLIKGDFERMKIMGLDPNEPWELVCKILDFCDDGYFNMRALNMFSIYVTGYFDCYRKLNSEKIENIKKNFWIMKGMYYICYLVVMLVLVVTAEIINFTSKTVCGKKAIKCFDL